MYLVIKTAFLVQSALVIKASVLVQNEWKWKRRGSAQTSFPLPIQENFAHSLRVLHKVSVSSAGGDNQWRLPLSHLRLPASAAAGRLVEGDTLLT